MFMVAVVVVAIGEVQTMEVLGVLVVAAKAVEVLAQRYMLQ